MFKESKKMKKLIGFAAVGLMSLGLLAGCGSNSKDENGAAAFDNTKNISVVSREDGSGTRGAFIELFGIQTKDANGNKVDHTTPEAIIATSTEIVISNISGDPYAIGYCSLGSLNDTVKALSVDGAAANAENVKNGTYKISRTFNIATKGEPTGVAKDFISFILSKEGQDVVANGYIKINDNAAAYSGNKPAGKIVVAGSSSVTPIMEKLKEAYMVVNPNAEIEIQESDSTTGMNNTIDGICDIGMASRELSDTEKQTLTSTQIALDGIAVIVNNTNPANDLKYETVKNIYTGNITTWADTLK